MEKELTDIFGVSPYLSELDNQLDWAEKKWPSLKTYFTKYTNPVGIELEMEGIDSNKRMYISDRVKYWRYHEDNSLRNHGAEWVSDPLSGQNIDYAIKEISELVDYVGCQHSIRTSTHVHVNVAFMTIQELKSLVLLSGLFEPMLFSICESSRKGNPYCYPLTSLHPKDILKMHEDLKYCAVNLAPVPRQLTVEYRHLEGTCDWRKLRRWVQLICKMQYYASTNPPKDVYWEVKNVVESGGIDSLVKKVFGATSVLFNNTQMCSDSYIWATIMMEQ